MQIESTKTSARRAFFSFSARVSCSFTKVRAQWKRCARINTTSIRNGTALSCYPFWIEFVEPRTVKFPDNWAFFWHRATGQCRMIVISQFSINLVGRWLLDAFLYCCRWNQMDRVGMLRTTAPQLANAFNKFAQFVNLIAHSFIDCHQFGSERSWVCAVGRAAHTLLIYGHCFIFINRLDASFRDALQINFVPPQAIPFNMFILSTGVCVAYPSVHQRSTSF